MRQFLAFLFATVVAHAEVTLAPLFQSGAVVQHGEPLPIWGRAHAGERVTVKFAGQDVSAVAADDGRWITVLEPVQPSTTGQTLTAIGENTVEITNVLVGDVWLCSGQSNMEWPVRLSDNAQEEMRAANNPLIRHFKVQKAVAETPVDTAQGEWVTCSPETVGEFTAVGYFFARDLQPRVGVPIGLINSTWGGTPIEAWMSPGALLFRPQFAAVRERWIRVLQEYPERKAEYDLALAAREAEESAPRAAGARPPKPRPYAPPGPGHSWTPSGLYNGMIHPLVPYGLRGVLWYQGETNASRANEYTALFEELILSWRRHFAQPELYFSWVQLANFSAGNPAGRQWAELREAQSRVLAIPYTAQALAIDIGDSKDIHPRNKQEVGRRLALLARAKVFGATLDFSGPVFEKAEREGAAMRIYFTHAVSGLIARNRPLQSFEIAGPDQKFHPATAKIEKNTVVVSASQVLNPVAVRYAWFNDPDANLCNGAGLPAAPFRTDSW